MTTVCYFLAEEDGVCRISHSRGGDMVGHPPSYDFFLKPPIKTDAAAMGCTPPPPLKSEAPLI